MFGYRVIHDPLGGSGAGKKLLYALAVGWLIMIYGVLNPEPVIIDPVKGENGPPCALRASMGYWPSRQSEPRWWLTSRRAGHWSLETGYRQNVPAEAHRRGASVCREQ
jgi:hypothetical protein